MLLLVVTDGNPLSVVPNVRAEIRALDPSGPVTAISTVEAEIGESLAVRRFQAWLITVFSSVAVLLAAVGIFGLMAHMVVRRTTEIGVRVAVGATQSDILALVVREGLLLAGIGIAAGVFGALAFARGLASLLFGVAPSDPVSYVAAAVVMATSVTLACSLPAWRAARVDPIVALRHDG
jgi:putative ABC transport system permease protein